MSFRRESARGSFVITGSFLSWLFCFALFCVLLPFDRSIYDEGSILVGATNVLAGRFPTTDFWSIYPAGAYVWVALLLSLFGKQIIVLRIVTAATLAIGPAICFALSYRTRSMILTVAGVAGLSLWIAGTHPNSGYPPSILVVLGAGVLLLVLGRRHSLFGLMMFGLAVGVFATMRLDFGFFVWFATAVGLLLDSQQPPSRRFLNVIAFGIGAGGVILACIGVYWLHGGIAALQLLFDRLLRFPAGPFHAARDLPFPIPFGDIVQGHRPVAPGAVIDGLMLSCYYIVMAALPILTLLALRDVLRPKLEQDPKTSVVRFSLALFAMAAIAPFLGRSHPVQGWPFVTLGMIVWLWMCRSNILIGILCAVIILVGGLETARALDYDYSGPSVALDSPQAAGIRLRTQLAWYNDVIRTARHADVIYSAPETHQHVNSNDTLLYFLLGQLPPTSYYEVHPLVTDQARVQARILAELEDAKPDLIVSVRQTDLEPNLSSVSSGVTLLDDAISQHCRQTKQINVYTFFACEWN